MEIKKAFYLLVIFFDLLIKTGIFEKGTYSMIKSAFNLREKSDLGRFFYIVSKEDAEKQLENAEKFLAAVRNFLESNFGMEL